ncbi:MAG: lipopolysaccharide heptosyltransferase II [Deltaproteobacteria bacterium]|nr:lipopolysaccharide heptosyltransferase II [Deltaproteobacteria bacterium]
MAAKEKKCLIVRAPNWIGDAVLCTPALGALRRLYPVAAITVLAKPSVAPVFQNSPDVTDIMVYDDKDAHKGIAGRVRLSGEIRKRRFDVAVLFQNAFDAAFLSFISGIPERIGFARDLRGPLLTKAVTATKEIKAAHQVYYYLHLIEAMGGAVSGNASPRPRLYVTRDERKWAKAYLKTYGLAGRPLVGVSPGASYGQAKRWLPERFAKAVAELGRRHNAATIIFGAQEDVEAVSIVERLLPFPCVNCAGKLTLRQFMALLIELDIFIANDSGPMHLGSALGVPTIGIFCSTDPALTGPVGAHARAVLNRVPCSPCFKRTCRFGHYDCLASVSVDMVIEAAEALMRASEKGAKGAVHASS